MKPPRSAIPFLALAAAFIVIGMTSNRTFLYVGIAFLAIGVGAIVRSARR